MDAYITVAPVVIDQKYLEEAEIINGEVYVRGELVGNVRDDLIVDLNGQTLGVLSGLDE